MFWRFVLVGVLNTLVGLGVNYLVLFIMGRAGSPENVSFWVASAANYTVGSIISYFLNKYFTFKQKKQSAGEVVRFIINIVVCWVLAYGIAKPLAVLVLGGGWTWPWQSITGLPAYASYIATLAGAGLFVIFNYFGQRFFAFRADAADNGASEDGAFHENVTSE